MLLGVKDPESDNRFALLPEKHNPRRALLEPVLLTSNNSHVDTFILVGNAWDVACDAHSSSLEQAAWLRNRRRALATLEEMTDFVLVGVAETDSDTFRYALLPEFHNPRRALLHPVVLTSNNRRVGDYVDFQLVGTAKNVAPGHDASAAAQAAWLRNHRRTLPVQPPSQRTRYALVTTTSPKPLSGRDVELEQGRTHVGELPPPLVLPGGVYDCSYSAAKDNACTAWIFYEKVPRVDTPIPKRRASYTAKTPKPVLDPMSREERTSANSVMSLVIDSP